jgi:hypothetical protein
MGFCSFCGSELNESDDGPEFPHSLGLQLMPRGLRSTPLPDVPQPKRQIRVALLLERHAHQ